MATKIRVAPFGWVISSVISIITSLNIQHYKYSSCIIIKAPQYPAPI